MGDHGLTFFGALSTLKTAPAQEKAQELLLRAARQVEPLMQAHNWKVKKISEFFPKNASLLGLNVNRGAEVKVRLRQGYDKSSFLSYESILGTLLHELCHVVHSNHSAQFYALLDSLTAECETLMAKGITALNKQPFAGSGHKLGTALPKCSAAEAGLRAAEKRRASGTSRKLGGRRDAAAKCSPRELAALAALRRSKDAKWCGSTEGGRRVDNDEPTRKRKLAAGADDTEVRKKQDTLCEWACGVCTLLNPPLALMCSACHAERPSAHVHVDIEWACSACTLINSAGVATCSLCGAARP